MHAAALSPAFFGRLASRTSVRGAQLRSRVAPRAFSATNPRAFSAAVASSDEQQVRDLLKKLHTYTEDDATYFDAWKGWTCRPSGNPACLAMLQAMMASEDVTGVSGDLIDVKALDFSEDKTMAYSAVIASCLLYTSPSPRDQRGSRMPSSA